MSSSKKVLIVEDDLLLNRILRDILEENDYQVESAYDGHDALRLVSTFNPDAVILDIMMPGVNGYRVSRIIKTADRPDDSPPPKVLIYTARNLSHDPDREEMFRGFTMADAVMYKPTDPAQILKWIDDACDSVSKCDRTRQRLLLDGDFVEPPEPCRPTDPGGVPS
jgi:two-component system alkaline phosphatase synthesis response regulator PhoP/two-component system response regulator VicR